MESIIGLFKNTKKQSSGESSTKPYKKQPPTAQNLFSFDEPSPTKSEGPDSSIQSSEGAIGLTKQQMINGAFQL
jgi:hypothetical protein